jgi:hypothetical protein
VVKRQDNQGGNEDYNKSSDNDGKITKSDSDSSSGAKSPKTKMKNGS